MSLVLAGVGGQGVLLAARVLLGVARGAGYDVKESEVHGMAQRGGSVDCHVRYGREVHSPLVATGTSDFVVGFELLEAMRSLDYLAPGGTLIANRLRIDPAPVTAGLEAYPKDLENWIAAHVDRHVVVDAAPALEKAGTKRALNVVMLGVLSSHLEFEPNAWIEAMRSWVKPKLFEANLRAFEAGRELGAGRK